VPTLSVMDNVFLGVEMGARGLVSRAAQADRLAELAGRIGFTQHSSVKVAALSTAEQQKVEILRALARDATLLVMDEPTAALTREESGRLLDLTRDLARGGVTIIYVSHVLADVLALSDTVTVLKDGRWVKTKPAASQTVDDLVTAMLGRSMNVAFPEPGPVAPHAPVVLSVRGLSRPPAIHDVDLEVRAGEIVGLAGLVGSGRTEIARAIFGADPAQGEVVLDGKRLGRRSPKTCIKHGMAMLPESRKDEGLVMIRSVSENVAMAQLGELSERGVMRRGRERGVVAKMLSQVDVRGASPSLPVATLSGGNQQKVALTKWLIKRPRLLIADEPTRGVDVGAKAAMYKHLVGLAAEGVGVLLISSELEEVLGLAHRVLVVRRGQIVAEFPRERAHQHDVMRAAFSGERVTVGAIAEGAS
jgi:ABC-type sugar transport system ATPase subunit